MGNAYFFGYGSLVNRDTHGFDQTHCAKLTGWRRIWRHTTRRKVAYLTVVPDASCSIDGLIAAVPQQDWYALDIREGAYDRVPASRQIDHPLEHQPDIAVYAIPDGKHGAPSEAGPVLLSYIDVVVQGYLREFGEAGAQRFFDTTEGWNAPILDDRNDPIYPRHCTLSADEVSFVDDHLRRRSVTIIDRISDVPPKAWRE